MTGTHSTAMRRRAVMGTAVAALGLTAALPAGAAAAAPPPAHSLMGGSDWAASNWASSTGNQLSDVAKAIGSAGSGLDGTGVGIALIDTGVAPVPGLPAAHVVNGPDLSFDAQAANLRYLDEYGHGTHLAGIMVGNDPTTGAKGIAPGAKLTSVKVGAAGGVVDVTQVAAALNWVTQHRNDDTTHPIKVIELAYGTDTIPDVAGNDPLEFAVENAYRNGILVVVAGGNEGSGPDVLENPAIDGYMLSVGSADTKGTASQSDDTISTFTSTESYQQLDTVAPGEGIVSLRNPSSSIDLSYPGARVGDTLFRGSGTSQASAVVAAAAALLYQKQPKASPYEIRNWIRESAKPVTGSNASRTVGEINIANALKVGMQSTSLSGGYSSGLGSFESDRGDLHVVHNTATLSGSSDIFGAFNNSAWVSAVNKGTAWQGGVWMGHRLAGDGWTGTSWASRTWAAGTWSGTDWASQAWTDSSWSGHYWSGHYWSGGDWSGHYWSSSSWQATNFSAKTWASASWS